MSFDFLQNPYFNNLNKYIFNPKSICPVWSRWPYIEMKYLLNGPKIRPNNIIGIMIMLNKITTISILLINWFEIVRFFESMPYFSYQIIQNNRKFPRVSNIISETIYDMVSPGWGIDLEFLSELMKSTIVFKLHLSKVIW